MTKHRIAFLNGSLRNDSFHGRLGLAIMAATADRLEFVTPGLELPLYDQDLEGNSTPAEWTEFRNSIRNLDGVLFGSPEYNRSMTGALKNASIRSRQAKVFSKKRRRFSGPPGDGGLAQPHVARAVCLDLPMMQRRGYWVAHRRQIGGGRHHQRPDLGNWSRPSPAPLPIGSTSSALAARSSPPIRPSRGNR